MLTTYHCCLDLELEQPRTNHQTPDSVLDEEKIIQVGYVIYRLEPDFKVYDKICRNVNIGVPLSSFIKKLTGISDEDIKNGSDLKTVYDDLVFDQKMYEFSRVIKQWGGGDMDCLKKEVMTDSNMLKWEFGRSGCNIKHLYQVYAESNGLNTSGGLKKSLNRIGIGWEGGKAHNAAEDAYNTARMHNFLYGVMKSG